MTVPLCALLQQHIQVIAVFVTGINPLPAIATTHDMIKTTGEMEAGFMKKKGTDLFFVCVVFE